MIGKLRGRSAAELRDRLAQAARAAAERRGLMPTVTVPEGTSLAPLTPWPAPDATAIRLRLSASEHAALIARADRIVAGTFDVLGYTGLSYGSPVNWQRDPISGRSAQLVHWSRVPYLDHEQVGDHKVIWEVNRHQWFIMLGQAWQLTRNPAYATTAASLLTHWLDANAPKVGINWCSALELAFRVQSWIHGLRLFADAPELPQRLRGRLVESAALQIDHVDRNLSTWFSPNTHLTGEALAMLAMGCAWPTLSRAAYWREKGWRILCDEVTRQFRPDGVYFEQSAWYQSYSVDFYALGVMWARHAGLTVPPLVLERLRAGASALRAVTLPDGTIARLGDDDGGRTLPMTVAPFGDMTDSLWRAALLLESGDALPPSELGKSTLLWLEGASAFDRAASLAVASPQARSSRAFRSGGWVTLNSPGKTPSQDHCLVLDAGPHGALSSAHSHADALSVEVAVNGVPLIVDPGTGAYVGPSRRRYRSTAVHNTVTVDGADSSEQGTSFNWRTATDTQLDGFGTAPGVSWVAAFHDGYNRLPDPVRHRRIILRIDTHYWLMLDSLAAAADHDVALTFQGSATAAVEVLGGAGARISCDAASLMLACDPRLTSRLERRVVSPAYGAESPADAVVCSGRIHGATALCTVFGDETETGEIALALDEDESVWRVTTAAGEDLVAHPAGQARTLGPATFDGMALAVLGTGSSQRIVAVGAGTFQLDGHSRRLASDGIVVAHRSASGTWAMEY